MASAYKELALFKSLTNNQDNSQSINFIFMKHSKTDETERIHPQTIDQLAPRDAFQQIQFEDEESPRKKLSFQQVNPSAKRKGKGQRLLLKLKKKCQQDSRSEKEQTNQMAWSKNKGSRYIHRSRDDPQSTEMRVRILSILNSLNRSKQQKSEKAQTGTKSSKIDKSGRRKIMLNNLGVSWMQRQSAMVRKYGGDEQYFQKRLEDRSITNKINHAKASSDLSVDKLRKEYKQHRLVVHLRENYKSNFRGSLQRKIKT